MHSFDDAMAREIERHAVELARGAGRILAAHFGGRIDVEYKDDKERDPVTTADKATQQYLVDEIVRRFPDHGILGEEATKEERDSEEPARDVLWVLDPLDGTTNFLNGLPVFASSIGVMHRGRLAAGALYLPWPNDGGGCVLHCRRGGGCFVDGEPASVYETQEPVPNRLIGVPGYFGVANRFSKRLAGRAGEPRTTGSIAYELALTARGAMQYTIIGAPRLWDMAAGALAVMEAGGTVMTRFRGRTPVASPGKPGPIVGRKDAHHEGAAELGRAPGGGEPATGAPGGEQRAAAVQLEGEAEAGGQEVAPAAQ